MTRKPSSGDRVTIEVLGEGYQVEGNVSSADKLEDAQGSGYIVTLDNGMLGHLVYNSSRGHSKIPAATPAQRAASPFLTALAVPGVRSQPAAGGP
jgi:hypothetical protein